MRKIVFFVGFLVIVLVLLILLSIFCCCGSCGIYDCWDCFYLGDLSLINVMKLNYVCIDRIDLVL